MTGAVDVIILHPLPGPARGPLERALAEARAAVAEQNQIGFVAAGADRATIVRGAPDGRPFGSRLPELLGTLRRGSGLILLGSGALPLASASDRRAFVAAAAAPSSGALANNRYSADVVAVSASAIPILARLPGDFPADNALPRWLAEIGGVPVLDLRRRWRLAVDLDSPLDAILVAAAGGRARWDSRTAAALGGRSEAVAGRIERLRGILANTRAELVVAGRTSAATLGWLERSARCRVRAIVEERGLRASSHLALGSPEGVPARRPRSVLGMALERDGPSALGARLAELGDGALVDTRVLLADRLGAAEAAWPQPESRYASDLLDPTAVDEPWLAELTASAAESPIPILLGGHSLVGPGVRLIGSRR